MDVGRITICNCFLNDWEKRNEKISSKNSTLIEQQHFFLNVSIIEYIFRNKLKSRANEGKNHSFPVIMTLFQFHAMFMNSNIMYK